MSRTVKSELTVPEAALLVRRSTDTVYRWVRQGKVETIETTNGLLVVTESVLRAAASTRTGRPRVA